MKAVHIEWMDHVSHTDSWTKIDDSKDLKPVVVNTLGFVLREEKGYIILASSYNTEDQVAGDILILKSCITKHIVLSEDKKDE